MSDTFEVEPSSSTNVEGKGRCVASTAASDDAFSRSLVASSFVFVGDGSATAARACLETSSSIDFD